MDLFAFAGVEVVHAAADPVDEVADAGDLFLGGQGLGAGPVVEFGSGQDAFTVAQEIVEVGGQAGEVGNVGAEVAAAGAAEPEGTELSAGLDVAGLGAGSEGDGDGSDGPAGVFGVHQLGGLAPDAVAVAVELEGGDLVDGGAAAALADPSWCARVLELSEYPRCQEPFRWLASAA
ncbi:hypothetical protein [Streptomyces griseochromogenes]|uniref:hypothetical protein n=1 Tax=Streptomyces griseochromogenes TaxID=68214 RepID=UPI00378F1ED8